MYIYNKNKLNPHAKYELKIYPKKSLGRFVGSCIEDEAKNYGHTLIILEMGDNSFPNAKNVVFARPS
jgi:hypothetical protein